MATRCSSSIRGSWRYWAAALWLSLKRERDGAAHWARLARGALIALLVYVCVNIGISRTVALNARLSEPYPDLVVTNPVPLAFWQREVLWRAESNFGRYMVTFPFARSDVTVPRADNMADPRIAQWSRRDPAAQAFLFWSRLPVAELHAGRIILRDQRFMDPRIGDRFSVTLRPPE